MDTTADPQSRFGRERLFPNTPWSLILQSQVPEDSCALAALDALARAYWRPLYASVRAMGINHAQAEDEVQRTFEALLARDSLRAVMPGQVRFRSFLTACLKNTIVSSHRREAAQKRGDGVAPGQLDDNAALSVTEQALAASPELALDRAWAREVFERAFVRLEADALKRGREDAFTILRPMLRGEALTDGYAGLASQLHVAEGTVRKMAFDLRARLGAMIRQEVAATVADPAEVDDELRHLMALL